MHYALYYKFQRLSGDMISSLDESIPCLPTSYFENRPTVEQYFEKLGLSLEEYKKENFDNEPLLSIEEVNVNTDIELERRELRNQLGLDYYG